MIFEFLGESGGPEKEICAEPRNNFEEWKWTRDRIFERKNQVTEIFSRLNVICNERSIDYFLIFFN